MKDNWWESAPIADSSASPKEDQSSQWWQEAPIVSDDDTLSRGIGRGTGEGEKAIGGLLKATGNAASPLALSALQTLSEPIDENAPWYQKYITDPTKQNLAKVELAASALPSLLLPEAGKEVVFAGQQKVAENATNNPSFAGKVGEMIPSGAAYIGTGIATGGVAPLVGLAGLQTFGSKYQEGLEGGKTPEEAATRAYPSAVLSSATGALPVGGFGLGSGLVGHAIGGAVGGEAQNIANIVGELAIQKVNERPSLTIEQAQKEAYEQIKESGGPVAAVGALGGAVAHPFAKLAERSAAKATSSTIDSERPTQVINPTTGEIEDEASPTGAAPQEITPQVTQIQEQPQKNVDYQGRIEPTLERSQPEETIHPSELALSEELKLSPTTDIDTAASTLDAIKSGDKQNIHQNTVDDLIKTGEIAYDNGNPVLTKLGNKLLDEINATNPNVTEKPVTEELPAAINPVVENQAGTLENTPQEKTASVLESATPAEEKAIADYQDAKQMEIPFSVTPKQKDIGSLVVQHNLTAENLEHAHKMGGIAVPSLAIVKGEHPLHSFGEISLIGEKDLVNPKGSSKNKVYGSDVYSSRYPNIQYHVENRDVNALNDKLRPYIEKSSARELDLSNIQDSGQKEIERNSAVIASFLDSKGIDPEYVKKNDGIISKYDTENSLKSQIDKNNLRNEFSSYVHDMMASLNPDEKIFNGYTPSGNRKYLPHDLDTVVKLLTKKVRGGENFNYGVGSIRAEYSKQFKSLADIKAHENRIVDSKTFDKIKEDVDAEFFKLADKWRDFSHNKNAFGFLDNFSEHLKEAAKDGLPAINNEYYDGKVPQEILKETAGFLNKLKDFNTEYFEAKLQRSVGISEFKGAVVPDGAQWDKSVETLRKNGINRIERYTKNDEESRKQAIGKFNDTFFKVNESQFTPTERFTAQQEDIKSKLDDIIKRINPSVKTEFSDKLFGEGEAIKASGGNSTERQEVAGSYNHVENLIKASTNLDKWNPVDTAYHEAYHSVRDMVNDGDHEILKKAFPGTDRLSQPEHEAVEFARFMTDKNATGFSAAVKRIFSAIRQALRDIGRTFKLGKFNSIEDIFNRTERGSVYNAYQEALRNGDIKPLQESNLSPESKEQAIKEASPTLHDIVYKAMSEKDEEALKNINLENNGTPVDKLKAITSEMYNKTMDTAHDLKEKALRSTVDVLSIVTPKSIAEKAIADVENTIAKTARRIDVKSSPINAAENIGRVLLTSNDGRMRWIGRKYNSPIIHTIADFFHPDPGTGKAIAETFPEEMSRIINTNMNEIGRILNPLPHETQTKVAYYMQHPEEWSTIGTKEGVGRAASVLSRVVQDLRKELASAGFEVPEVAGFFPRIYDTVKIMANEMSFKKAAKAAYLDTYREYFAEMSPKDRNAELNDMVDRWYNNVALQDDGINSTGNDFTSTPSAPPAPSSFKARTLSKAADDIMREFLMQDPVGAMSSLIYKSARKSAWERRFGGDKWNELKQQMIKEGVDGEGIRNVANIIKSNTSQMGTTLAPTTKNLLATMRYYSSLRYLSKVAFIHTSLPLLTGIRTGRVNDAFRAYGDSVRALISNGDQIKNMKVFSDLLGLTGDSAEHMLLQQQMGDMPNAKLDYANKRWHDRIGITKLVASAKVGAIRSLQYFISHLAEEINSGSESSRLKSSEFLARELGVPQDKLQDFSKWVLDGGGDNIKQSLVLDRNDPNAVLYQTALRRAMDQTMQNPTAATRQYWANHPVGSMIYSLTAYKMAYMKNVLQRSYRMTNEAVTGKGYSIADRVALAAPAMMLPLTVAFAAAYEEARDAIPGGRKFTGNRTVRALERSELFGEAAGAIKYIASRKVMEPIVGKEYHKEYEYQNRRADILGPNASLLKDVKDMIFNIQDLQGEKKAKTAEMRKIFDLVLAPSANAAISTYSPYALPAFAAIQAINSKAFREKVTK